MGGPGPTPGPGLAGCWERWLQLGGKSFPWDPGQRSTTAPVVARRPLVAPPHGCSLAAAATVSLHRSLPSLADQAGAGTEPKWGSCGGCLSVNCFLFICGKGALVTDWGTRGSSLTGCGLTVAEVLRPSLGLPLGAYLSANGPPAASAMIAMGCGLPSVLRRRPCSGGGCMLPVLGVTGR